MSMTMTIEAGNKVDGDGRIVRGRGAAPWAPLATDVKGAATAGESIKTAGLDWTTRIESIQTTSGLPIVGRRSRAVIRNDNNTVLGVVGPRHKIIDNATCFDFMDAVAGRSGGITYETAGYLGIGERIWLLARTDNIIRVGKGGRDEMAPYLLLHNAHDGSFVLRVLFTAIRVVCQNTLNEALQDRSGVAIRHTGDVTSKVAQAQEVLGLAHTAFDDLAAQFTALSKHKLSDAQRHAFFKAAMAPAKVTADNPDAEDVNRRWPSVVAKLDEIAEAGMGQADFPEIRGTAWAAYNSITEYQDHHASFKAEGLSDAEIATTRLDQVWFGARARTKARALTAAVAMLN